jgi:hypothetical protein
MKRALDVLVPVLVLLVVLAAAGAAFIGYVAYCGMHPFKLPDAFDKPPSPDSARLGGVLESALSWAMRASGAVVTILGAALTLRRNSVAQVLSSVVVILAGAVLITQHWAAGVALGVVGVAAVFAMSLRRAIPEEIPEGGSGRAGV